MPLTSNGVRLLMRQLRDVKDAPVDGIALLPSSELSEVWLELDGPEGTPFSEGRFVVTLHFEEQYPEVPPRGSFRTPIFHPNVAPLTGEICVNALKRDWVASMGLRHILMVIRCLLVEPNPESALHEEAGRLILEDYQAYARQAAMMTRIHARRGKGVPRHHHSSPSTPSPSEARGETPTATTAGTATPPSSMLNTTSSSAGDVDAGAFAGCQLPEYPCFASSSSATAAGMMPTTSGVPPSASARGTNRGAERTGAAAAAAAGAMKETHFFSNGDKNAVVDDEDITKKKKLEHSACAMEGLVDGLLHHTQNAGIVVPSAIPSSPLQVRPSSSSLSPPPPPLPLPSSSTLRDAGLRPVDGNIAPLVADKAMKRAAEKRKSALRRL